MILGEMEFLFLEVIDIAHKENMRAYIETNSIGGEFV